MLETTSWQSDMPTFEGSGKEVELFDVYVIEGKYVRLIWLIFQDVFLGQFLEFELEFVTEMRKWNGFSLFWKLSMP